MLIKWNGRLKYLPSIACLIISHLTLPLLRESFIKTWQNQTLIQLSGGSRLVVPSKVLHYAFLSKTKVAFFTNTLKDPNHKRYKIGTIQIKILQLKLYDEKNGCHWGSSFHWTLQVLFELEASVVLSSPQHVKINYPHLNNLHPENHSIFIFIFFAKSRIIVAA